ncbi:hypothetical protein [Jannaschia ovalis]|uniref:Uncharacterized protein n=1 Tax=Jannaschia ovalis TaxID=3038773 RepID=A0ABY8L8R6_9RHOB|nr:hypothetical protein [Jannaschia sp. GRR-S6-38]WGH77754.1 hypothetical protein P8627_12015 [Jannaschia sp. GRR-S6-38]
MRRAAALLAIASLAGCGGAADAPAVARMSASDGGVCPAPDPVRDGPLVDAIRQGDPAPLRAALARDPSDARAAAALAVVTGRGPVDADQAACFAPYLT